MNNTDEITAKFHITELQNGWDEDAKPSEKTARLILGAKTDLGCVRENNEDKFEFFIPTDPDVIALKGSLLAVADGMGGHAAGQIASELCLKTLVKNYYSDTHADVSGALRVAVGDANTNVFNAASVPSRSGMGCTLTAAVVRGDELYVAQVGDSRLYLLSDGSLEQVTEDHSWVNDQVKLGAISAEDAQLSPYRNVITRSIGNNPNVKADISRRELKAGDVLMLCTDGLNGVVSDNEMCDILVSHGPSEACLNLVELALDYGGPDNVTVLVARIEEIT